MGVTFSSNTTSNVWWCCTAECVMRLVGPCQCSVYSLFTPRWPNCVTACLSPFKSITMSSYSTVRRVNVLTSASDVLPRKSCKCANNVQNKRTWTFQREFAWLKIQDRQRRNGGKVQILLAGRWTLGLWLSLNSAAHNWDDISDVFV